MKNWIRSLLAVGAMMVAGSAAAEAKDVLRIGSEGAYPPFNMIDKDGNLQGFDIDIAKALCDEMKVECKFVTQDWDGIIPGLLSKKYDAIVASMSDTPERRKAVGFSNKYYSNMLRFAAPKGTKLAPTADGMKGKTIGAQRATIAAQYAKEHFPGAEVKVYDTQENAWLDLAAGRTDVVLADMLVAYEWLSTPDGADYAFLGEPFDIDDKISIAVRKQDKDLAKKLNDAIDAIRANGTYQKINAKYFPFDIY
ncbi:Amino acid ABC transporter, periplasmic amino acid-binding protein [uncultured Alphaproteobacteria bacterium]|uniref:Amino acid ABC transporter, periplasmic amino acid-binding protein n=1 Tax=uncultured Alphaproteobacteria bacterium TaxID=91750 RepID=A0A212JBD4_9PROT|nr:Amino acid ABC transporter, periplasmic amino acid-binding protein [uncultured Alphaproteobacteria bacterium]